MATQAQITINAVVGSVTTLPLGTLVQLNNNGLGDETTYLWTILAQPEGPTDALSSTSIQAPTFTPTKEGSYLLRLVVNLGQPNEQTDQVVAAVRELETGDRIPAAGETTEVDPADGWANTAVDRILQRVTRFTDSGIAIGSAGVGGLVPGDVVWVTDTTTIATGLPDERTVPVFTKALATDPLAMSSDLFIVQQGVGGSLSPGLGDLVRVVQFGLFGGVPYGVLPTVGDPIYVSDLGTLDLTPGTLERQLGNVASAGGGTYTGWFDPASATQIGIAGGDLSGTYPNPDVVGLQGDPLAASVGDGFVKRNAANTAWESVPYGTTANTVCEGNDPRIGAGGPPSGPAGGILGYTGSTYPNPNGLAAGTIPIKGTWTPAIPYPATQPMIIQGDQPPVGSVGYPLSILASKGGDAAAFVGPGNTGGSFTLAAGAGGDGGAGGPAGQGGAAQLLGGDAGAGNGVGLGGATPYGGAALVKGGTGTAERGGHATLQGGTGSGVVAGVGGPNTGGFAYVTGGTGGAGTGAAVAAIGGDVEITGGAAGANGGAGGNDGGFVVVRGGAATGLGTPGGVNVVGGASASAADGGVAYVLGGDNSSTGDAGSATLQGGAAAGAGNGGTARVIGGGYGLSNPGFSGPAGGAIVRGGDGNAQAGGDAYVLGGDSVSGAGGNAALVGGTSSTSDGGDVAVSGGTSTTAGGGGNGGEGRVTGGNGSDGTVGVPSGSGGPATLGGGEAGGNAGGGAGLGGDAKVYGGDGTAQGFSGRLYLSDFSDKGKARPSGMSGGGVEIWTTYGGNAAASIPGGDGGELQIDLGKGGNASTGVGETAGAAGAMTVTAGKGGTANAAGGHPATVGGAITITAGAGGDGNGATAGAAGGAALMRAGAGGAAAAGAGGAGGDVGVVAGAGAGAAAGGGAVVIAGEGGASGGANGSAFLYGATDNNGQPGGNAVVVGGGSNTSGTGGVAGVVGGLAPGGTGGSARLFGGTAAGGTGGDAYVRGGAGTTNGTVHIGDSATAAVNLGASAIDVATKGRNVEEAASVSATAPLAVNTPTVFLTNAGAVDLGGAALNVVTSGITNGTRVTFIQTGAGTTKFHKDSGNNTYLQLSNASHTLGQYDSLTLIFTGTYWVEVGLVNI